MGANRTVTLNYNGATSGASGDTYITINENVVFKNRTVITT